MKFIYKVKVKDQKYIFESKEQFEGFKASNPSLTFEVIERIDIIEGMEKIARPPKVTIGTVLGLLNDFIVEQREFNEQQIKFNNKVEAFNNKVQNFMDEQIKFNKQQLKFNHEVIVRLDKIDTRIDNLVSKNNLKE